MAPAFGVSLTLSGFAGWQQLALKWPLYLNIGWFSLLDLYHESPENRFKEVSCCAKGEAHCNRRMPGADAARVHMKSSAVVV